MKTELQVANGSIHINVVLPVALAVVPGEQDANLKAIKRLKIVKMIYLKSTTLYSNYR